ncbi:DUF2608 domain-containing protein [Candidatus Protochlamydia phocaeensis]|uniref:DUF2608 domain-containing protein n=1 Tax=Candidatus Protochlamydia phocaeensis TaxID=1414722 RepID=UPI00083949B4|nr:DUF2608 domain-containing protein [Candidatus Protochlamydia phocaeensis]
MQTVSSCIIPIYSLLELPKWAFKEQNEEDIHPHHLKVIALDFDQTLAKACSCFGSEHWYHFLVKHNQEASLPADIHYPWSVKVRYRVSYTACENAEKIRSLIKKFRESNWMVVILTSRGPDMKEVTLKHIQEANLPFDEQDIIFNLEEGDAFQRKKHNRLMGKLAQSPRWEYATKLTVLFADDHFPHCEDLVSLPSLKITQEKFIETHVHAFHYLKEPPSAHLSSKQMKNLTIQLQAYKEQRTLPEDDEEPNIEHVKRAQHALEIADLTEKKLFEALEKIAQLEGMPFKVL